MYACYHVLNIISFSVLSVMPKRNPHNIHSFLVYHREKLANHMAISGMTQLKGRVRPSIWYTALHQWISGRLSSFIYWYIMQNRGTIQFLTGINELTVEDERLGRRTTMKLRHCLSRVVTLIGMCTGTREEAVISDYSSMHLLESAAREAGARE